MQIRQDPITKLWCRADGAVLMPPTSKYSRFKKFRWTFGSGSGHGYRVVGYKGKNYPVHQLVCRAFHGLPPADKPFVDHINRRKDDNRIFNLRFADMSLNNTNRGYVDAAFEKYGVREREDKEAYKKAYSAEKRAQGLTFRKGSNGKCGWYPRIRPMKEGAPCM